MTEREKLIADAESLVRTVLSSHFGQKIEGDALKVAAEKIASGVPSRSPGAQKRAA